MYLLETLDEVEPQVEALPAKALAYYAELRTVLETAPWNGKSQKKENPDAPVRALTFGEHSEGFVTYLILENQRRVVILNVIWPG